MRDKEPEKERELEEVLKIGRKKRSEKRRQERGKEVEEVNKELKDKFSEGEISEGEIIFHVPTSGIFPGYNLKKVVETRIERKILPFSLPYHHCSQSDCNKKLDDFYVEYTNIDIRFCLPCFFKFIEREQKSIDVIKTFTEKKTLKPEPFMIEASYITCKDCKGEGINIRTRETCNACRGMGRKIDIKFDGNNGDILSENIDIARQIKSVLDLPYLK
ncbi:MAG: hypothetical protein EAX96_02675 [Candidatus Lokiarchaeota archaeon]|nr:hypothetical protein [Candidatus Lokiarchaeota archaeon]